MPFLVAFGIWFASMIIGELMRPKLKDPEAKSIGDFQVPTAEEGRAIGWVWGTCEIKGPNVLWYGDLSAEPHGNLGFRYYLGIHYGLCSGPIDELVDVLWDDRSPGFEIVQGSLQGPDPVVLTFDSMELFGGTTGGEGGIAGEMAFYKGSANQPFDTYLRTILGPLLPGYPSFTQLPAYPYLCHAVLRHMYIGSSAYIKCPAFRVRRCPNGLGLSNGHHRIATIDANPACMIYEILTDPIQGLGYSSGMIDVAAFREVGEQLWLEGFGLSMQRQDQSSAREIIADILRHIDGVCFADPETGLETIRLARASYEIETLPVLDADHIRSVEITRPSAEKTSNVVRIRYINVADGFQERVIPETDMASIQSRGQQVIEEFDFLGASRVGVAQMIAQRSLKVVSYEWAQLSIECDRTAWALRPASVFRLNWPPLGITGLVCRVVRIGLGTLLETEVRIEAVEDVFSTGSATFSSPPASSWVDPVNVPLGPPLEEAFHALPYPLAGASYLSNQLPGGMSLVARESASVSTGHPVYVSKTGGVWEKHAQAQLTPVGYLLDTIDELAGTIDVSDGIDVTRIRSLTEAEFLSGGNLAIIAGSDPSGRDSEIVAFQTITAITGGYRLSDVRRGCIDTVPAAFVEGAKVWFVSYGFGSVQSPRPVTGSVNLDAKVALENPHQIYEDWMDQPTHQLTFDPPGGDFTNREDLPYPPVDVKENGEAFPESIEGELTVTWSHRNRLGVWDYGNAGATSAPEDGTHYVLRVYGELETLVHEETGLTGTTWTYLEATEIAESGLSRLNAQLRVVLFAIRGTDPETSPNSWQAHDWTFARDLPS